MTIRELVPTEARPLGANASLNAAKNLDVSDWATLIVTGCTNGSSTVTVFRFTYHDTKQTIDVRDYVVFGGGTALAWKAPILGPLVDIDIVSKVAPAGGSTFTLGVSVDSNRAPESLLDFREMANLFGPVGPSGGTLAFGPAFYGWGLVRYFGQHDAPIRLGFQMFDIFGNQITSNLSRGMFDVTGTTVPATGITQIIHQDLYVPPNALITWTYTNVDSVARSFVADLWVVPQL